MDAIWWTGTPYTLMNYFKMSKWQTTKMFQDIYEVSINKSTRYIGKSILQLLWPLRINSDNESLYDQNPVWKLVCDQGPISIQDLKQSGLKMREITKELSLLANDWLVVVQVRGKEKTVCPYFSWEGILQKGEKQDHIRHVMSQLFRSFGFLTLDEIRYFLGDKSNNFQQTLVEMMRENRVSRDVKLMDARLEFFRWSEADLESEHIDDCEYFVANTSDPLVELLLLERIKLKSPYYVIMENGIPKAQFRIKQKKKEIEVTDFRRIDRKNTFDPNTLNRLNEWCIEHGFKLVVDYRDSLLGKASINAINLLLKRQYEWSGDSLILSRHGKAKPRAKFEMDYTNGIQWLLGHHFSGIKNALEALEVTLQANTPMSLFIRAGHKWNEIDPTKACMIFGANQRFGLISLKNLSNFVASYNKQIELSIMDKQILQTIEKNPGISTYDIMDNLNLSLTKLLQRILYLERNHRILREGIFNLKPENATWVPMSEKIEDRLPTQAEASENLLIQLLSHQLPLSTIQISRYFGWTFQFIEMLLENLMKKSIVEKGHFIDFGYTEYQYKLISADYDKNVNTEREVYFAPFSDPLGILYLPQLIENNPILRPNNLREFEQGELIFVGGNLIGYLTRRTTNFLSNSGELVEFITDFRLLPEWISDTIIFKIFDAHYTLHSQMQNGKGAIGKVNGKHIKELNPDLIFLAETSGYVVD